MGQIADYICLDGTIPVERAALRAAPDRRADDELRAGRRQRLPRRRRQHASADPVTTPTSPATSRRPRTSASDILRLCVEVGGCLTGEHGVGVEKRDLMDVQYAPADLEAQMRVKDVFDPRWLLNPAKVFPLAASASRRAA
jgi:glycolate oxidase